MNGNTAEEAAHRQTEVRKSQLALFSLQSDRKRLERKQNDLQGQVRQTQLEISHLTASLETKEAELRSSGREIELIDEEIMRAKKQMNSL